MPAGGKSFEQAYNAQAGVDTETMLVVTETVTTHANDKQEIEPSLQALKQLAVPLGPAEAILADTGYYSEANVRACEAAGVTPYIAMGRDRHHPPVEQRWTEPPPLAPDTGPVDALAHRLSTIEGRAIYGKRKSTVEPVFGIIKSVMGFRQFHLRGLDNVSGEWTLVTMAWSLKRRFSRARQASPTAEPGSRSGSQSRKHRSGSLRRSGNVSRQSISSFIRRIGFQLAGHRLFDARLLLPSPTGC